MGLAGSLYGGGGGKDSTKADFIVSVSAEALIAGLKPISTIDVLYHDNQ
jgi:hypothetical protein